MELKADIFQKQTVAPWLLKFKHGRLIRVKLKEEEFIKLINTSKILEEGKSIKIFDLIKTISGIRGEFKRLKMQNKPDAVFIDYLQLIRTNEKFQNTTQR